MDYCTVPCEKFADIIQHLRHNFPDEPLNASVGLCVHGQPCELLEQHDLHTLEDGLSIMAVDKDTGDIAGVSLNGISNKGDTERSIEEMKNIDNLQYHRIFGLLNQVNLSANLFEKYQCDRIFEIRILSVDSRFRGKGIAKQLFQKSLDLAMENGFKLAKTDATSYFTQKVAESCGFVTEKAVRYGDYKDEQGRKIYETKQPHDFYKIMIKQLN